MSGESLPPYPGLSNAHPPPPAYSESAKPTPSNDQNPGAPHPEYDPHQSRLEGTNESAPTSSQTSDNKKKSKPKTGKVPPQKQPSQTGVDAQRAPQNFQPAPIGYPMAGPVGNQPFRAKCPNCKNDVVTRVIHKDGTKVWMIFLILLVLGIFFLFPLCCSCIPFCMEGCKVSQNLYFLFTINFFT